MTDDGADRARRFPVGARVERRDLEADPHPTIDRLRRTEPVSWLPALGCWLITERATAIEILRNPSGFTVDDPRFSTAQVVGPSMLSLDGPAHRRHRTPFVGPFRSREVNRSQRPIVSTLASDLVDRLAPGGRAELRTELAGPLAVTTIGRVLGLVDTGDDPDSTNAVLDWYRAIVAGVLAVDHGRPVPTDAAAAVASLAQRVAATVEHRGQGQPSMLASIAGSSDLSARELFSNVAVVMFGAIETSEAMTANALFHLLSDRARWNEVAADRSLLDGAIEESLRLEPAAAVVDRYATADITMGQADIGAGDLVRVSLGGANRDPALFDDPHRFDLHRANADAHLAFVQGPHACIGGHLARAETAAAIDAVLDRLPGIALEPAATPPTGLIFRKPDRLPATW